VEARLPVATLTISDLQSLANVSRRHPPSRAKHPSLEAGNQITAGGFKGLGFSGAYVQQSLQ
jgi:hypothetical protein